MKDLVSVITPMYNGEKKISDTIESVINQDYDDWEMLIIDDCSQDGGKQIVQSYIEKDRRIKLITLKQNKGVAFARNTGIKAANGRFIAFLDSDDLWHPNKLSKQVKFMKENNYHFTFTGYELIDDNGIKMNKVIKIPEIADYGRLLKGNPIGCLTVIIDRKKIKSIEMIPQGHEDYLTWLNITREGNIAYGLDKNLALYRKSYNSLSSNKFKAIAWTWNIYRKNHKLGLIKSIRCLAMYSINTFKKYYLN